MGLPKARRRPLKPWLFVKKAAYPLLLFVVALSDANWGAAAAAAAAAITAGILVVDFFRRKEPKRSKMLAR